MSAAWRAIARPARATGGHLERAWAAVTAAWLIAAVLASGCRLLTPDTEGDLRGLLRDYVIAQEVYYAGHNRYAPVADSLTRGFAVPPWMRVRVHQAGAAGHSAHAWSPRDPDLVCVVFAGPLPPELDEGSPGDPMCGAPARFERLLSGWTPPGRGAPRLPRAISILGVVLAMVALLAAAYWGGVFLDRRAQAVPGIRAVVFWTPAVLVTVFLGLSMGLAPVLRGTAGYGWGWVPIGLVLGLAVNLGLFSVPRAVRRPRSGDWWAALGLLVVAAAAFAAFARFVAADVAAGRRSGLGPTADTVVLAVAASAMSLLNLMGVVQLVRARRRARPAGRSAPAADDAGVEVPEGTESTKARTRRRALLVVALAAAVLYLVDTWTERSGKEPEPNPVGGFLEAYVRLQEAYHADHGRYAGAPDRGAIPVPIGVTLRIMSASTTAHSAIAYADSAQQLCAVWVGEPIPRLDHDRQADPVCDAPPRFEPWLVGARRAASASSDLGDTATGARPDALPRAEPGSDQDSMSSRIFAGDAWSTGRAFLDWAAVIALRSTAKGPCSDGTKVRLARSLDDVLFCQRVGVVGGDGEPGGGLLVWSIVRSTAVPRYDCNAGISYLEANRIVGERSPADCAYVLDIEDPSDTPIAAFRVRETGAIGLVVDSHGAECAGRYALVAKDGLFETVHTFFLECAR